MVKLRVGKVFAKEKKLGLWVGRREEGAFVRLWVEEQKKKGTEKAKKKKGTKKKPEEEASSKGLRRKEGNKKGLLLLQKPDTQAWKEKKKAFFKTVELLRKSLSLKV